MQKEVYPLPYMVVNGEGVVTAEPNSAVIELGVQTENKNVAAAQQENAETMHQILQSLLTYGVGEGAIQTSQYTVSPKYDFVDGEQILKGYQVNHLIRITLGQVGNTGVIIDGAVSNGANQVAGITFTARDLETYEQQALSGALDDALVKARTLASNMQVNMNPVPIKIIETTKASGSITPVYFKTQAAATASPLMPGQLEIRAGLEVQFEYGKRRE